MSKILILGGVGAMTHVAVEDLVKTSDFKKIMLADINVREAEELAAALKDDRVSVVKVDANNISDVVDLIKGYDVVANGLPRSFHLNIIPAAIEAGVNYIDITSLTPETLALDDAAKKVGISCIGGVGMAPGITNILAQVGADRLDSVEQITISIGGLTPEIPSPGLLQSFLRGFDPREKYRYCYEDGKLIDNPPFSGAKVINFPEPIGKQTAHFVPHGEEVTLSKNIKGVKRVYFRRGKEPVDERLMHVLNDFGIFTAKAMEFEGKKIVPLEFIRKYLLSNPRVSKTEVQAICVQVEVSGVSNGKKVLQQFVLNQQSVGERDAYARNIGYPLSIGIQFLLQGKARKKGVDGVEVMLPVQEFFDELQKRGIRISEEVIEL